MVPRPVSAFVIPISAEKCMQPTWTISKVGICLASSVVALVVFSGLRERCQFSVDVSREGLCRTGCIECAKWQNWRCGERSSHHRDRAEYVGADQCAPARQWRTRITSDHMSGAIAKSRQETDNVSHHVRHTERTEIRVILTIPSRGAAISAQVRRNDMKSGLREWRGDLSPAKGKFRKPMEQHHAWPA